MYYVKFDWNRFGEKVLMKLLSFYVIFFLKILLNEMDKNKIYVINRIRCKFFLYVEFYINFYKVVI